MLFSFLVPVYNTEKYLEQCVASLLAQKGADFEILLLDDGSGSPCAALCDRLAAEHPGIIRVTHKENEGLLMTRRRGFQEARGDWFICVDSDDCAAPGLLEQVVRAIGETGADMVMYNFEYFSDQGRRTPSRLKLEDRAVFEGDGKQRIYEKRLLSVDVNMMWMRAIRRDILDFGTDYSSCGIRNMCEDAVQVLPLYSNARKIVYLDSPLYCYRKADGSITSRVTLAHWQAIHRSFVLEQPYAQAWQVSEEAQRRRYTRQMENICNCVRWLYANEPAQKLPEMIRTIKEESMFRVCLEHCHTKYASSRYSAVCMPMIAAALKKEHFRFLEHYFKLENWLRRR